MEHKQLGDIATYINGYAFKPENRGTEGLPIIRIQDLTGNGCDLGFYDGEYPTKIEINNGDVLISWSASLGVYIWNNGKALLNQHIFKVIFDKEMVNKEYFVFAVQHKLEEMASRTHGATMKHIVKKDFDSTLIPFPTVERQKKIADILSKVSRIIEARQKELQHFNTLIKARFVEMFGTVSEARFTLKTLPEFVSVDKNSIKRGPFGGALKKDDFVGDGYLVYEQRHAIHNDFEYAKYYITDEKYQEMIGFKVVPGDLLISCSGVTLGRISEVPKDAKEGIINQALLKLSLDEKIMNNVFFINQFRSDEIQGTLFGFSRGSGIPNMPSMGEVKSVRFICPPIELQNKYCSFVHQVDKSKVVCVNNP
ncbi:MAG: restriction endonuclease subunit S [Lachnospiraceae bacterium]